MSSRSLLDLPDDDDHDESDAWKTDLRRLGALALTLAIVAASTDQNLSGSPVVAAGSAWPAGCTPHGTSTPTPAMATARSGHTATLLRSGQVLVAGGLIPSQSETVTNKAELYDPGSGIWRDTGSMRVARAFHAAALLPSGKVLVAGGRGADGDGWFAMLDSAELYDPETGTWTETGLMTSSGELFAMIVLRSGKVFVTAGDSLRPNVFVTAGDPLRTTFAQLYDPGSGDWSTVSVSISRPLASATLLSSGKVLIAGGSESAELYDPVVSASRSGGKVSVDRYWHTATLLPSGKVLVAGGGTIEPPRRWLAAAELYDPATNTWSDTRPMRSAHAGATATLLTSGNVLVAGGGTSRERRWADKTVDLYDPATATWTAVQSMRWPRALSTATLLRSGAVLFAGGEDPLFTPQASAEIYVLTCTRP